MDSNLHLFLSNDQINHRVHKVWWSHKKLGQDTTRLQAQLVSPFFVRRIKKTEGLSKAVSSLVTRLHNFVSQEKIAHIDHIDYHQNFYTKTMGSEWSRWQPQAAKVNIQYEATHMTQLPLFGFDNALDDPSANSFSLQCCCYYWKRISKGRYKLLNFWLHPFFLLWSIKVSNVVMILLTLRKTNIKVSEVASDVKLQLKPDVKRVG